MASTPKAASKAASASRVRSLDWQPNLGAYEGPPLNFDRMDDVENRGLPDESVDDTSLATAILHANTSKLTEERRCFLNYLERSLEEIGIIQFTSNMQHAIQLTSRFITGISETLHGGPGSTPPSSASDGISF